MVLLPRYKEIDMSKYDPSIPPGEREAYYGLPKEVRFCSECVMSNQKPNSCYEFEHTINSKKKSIYAINSTALIPGSRLWAVLFMAQS